MTTAATCLQCGAELPGEAPEKLCPACQARRGLKPGARPKPLMPEKTLIVSAADWLGPEYAKPPHFGDYEVLSEIARGGMGVVYKARQISLNRLVALKMILSGQLASDAEIKRFLTEAEAAGNLHHPNIVTIYGVGEQQGQHYFSMKLVEGCSLAERVETGRWKLDKGKEAARLLSKVARAVHYAHTQGVLHRDLKPANILIDAEGEPHISDFGLARQIRKDSSLTLDGSVLGTPSFMAPEQAAGKTRQLTAAADIYSLGAILYYLLTGRPPFAAETPLDTMVQVLEGEVILPRAVNPRVPADLEETCLRCLEKTPERRYATAAALADDLDRFLRDEPVEVRAASLGAQVRQWARRQPALVTRLGGLGVCAVIAQATYQLKHPVTLGLHAEIMSLLGMWALASALCQWAMQRERWAELARFGWAAADVVLLTEALLLDEGLNGLLMCAYLALVAASGLWLRVSIVGFTTILAMLGSGVLVLHGYQHHDQLQQANWYLIFLATLAITGFTVSYLVYRVRALSRFYERRPLP